MTKALLVASLLGSSALASGCGGSSSSGTDWPKVDRAALEADLRKTDVEFAEATEKRGVEGWVSYFASDGAQLSARAEIVRGPDAVREQMTTFFAKGDRKLTWRPLLVQVSPAGDMGFTYGPYQVLTVGRDGATEVIRRGTYMTVWRREKDGRWKVVADLGSQEPRPLTVPLAASYAAALAIFLRPIELAGPVFAHVFDECGALMVRRMGMKQHNAKLGSLAAVAVLGAAATLLGGCVAEVSDRPVVVADQPAVVATAVPVDIETYPHVYYRGGLAYYVGERWYYRGPSGFVVFRHEPVELVRYRTAFRTRVRVY